MTKEELIKKWKLILNFNNEDVEELPESKWVEYAELFEKTERKHRNNQSLLKKLIPHIRKTGKLPEEF